MLSHKASPELLSPLFSFCLHADRLLFTVPSLVYFSCHSGDLSTFKKLTNLARPAYCSGAWKFIGIVYFTLTG